MSDHRSERARVQVFDLADANERAAFATLRASGTVRVVDTLTAQIRDLIEARQAGQPASEADFTAFWQQESAEQPAWWGRWIHYPWLHLVLRTLPPTELKSLRTDRNRYRILPTEQDKLGALRVGIVGLSVGQAIAVCMAQEGVGGTFHLADPDTLDLSNLNRLRAGLDTLGVPKVDLAARAMLRIDPYLTLRCYGAGVQADALDAFLLDEAGQPLDLLIEECDDLPLKILLRRRARSLGIPVLMATAEGGLIDVERFDLEPDRPLFHGLAAGLDLDALAAGDEGARVAFVMAVLGLDTLSPRTGMSLLEGGHTLASWPQLASSVALGAAMVTDAARRVALGELQTSGRWRVPLSSLGPASKMTLVDSLPAEGAAAEAKAAPSAAAIGHKTGALAPHPDLLRANDAPGPDAMRQLRTLARDQGLAPAVRQALLDFAVLTPSGGNAQPWKLEFTGDTLLISDDVRRPVPQMDPGRVSVRMAAGGVVESVMVAARALGLQATVTCPTDGSAIARVVFAVARTSAEATAADATAADATAADVTAAGEDAALRACDLLRQRCTNRRVTTRTPLPASARAAICEAATSAGARLVLLNDPAAQRSIGRIAGQADRLRFLYAPWREELTAEIRWTEAEAMASPTGLEVASLELDDAGRAGLPLLLHGPTLAALADARQQAAQRPHASPGEALQHASAELGEALVEPAIEAFAASAALAVVVVPPADATPFFTGGRALQRMWLAATAHDIAVHPWGSALFCFAALQHGPPLPGWMQSEISTMAHGFATTWPLPDGMPLMLMRLHTAPTPTARAPRLRVRVSDPAP